MGFSLKDPIQGSITGNAGSADVAKKTQAALTIQKNGTAVGSTFDGSTARTINITVPTTVASLTDAANYIKKTDYASTSSAGVVKLGTGLAIADGVLSVTGAATADSVEWSVVKNKPTAVSYWTNDAGYIKASNTMKGATATTAGSAGTVPAPAAGKEAQFLRGDGTWAVPSYATSAGSATTATTATHLVVSDGSNDVERPMLVTNLEAGATAQNVFYESTITANYAQSRITASAFRSGNATMKYNTTDQCIEFIFN